MKTLDELGLKFQTDKASTGHNYLNQYEMFLSPLRNEMFVFLELGVWEGASLKMWHEYFPNAIIYGADIEDKRKYEEDGVDTVIMNTMDEASIQDFIERNVYQFRVILDDAGHESEAQILAFNKLFPILSSGGYYIIEDCLCAFDNTRWGKNANVFDRIHQMVDEVNVGGKINTGHISSNKAEQVKILEGLNYFEANIEWVWVGMGCCIIKKI